MSLRRALSCTLYLVRSAPSLKSNRIALSFPQGKDFKDSNIIPLHTATCKKRLPLTLQLNGLRLERRRGIRSSISSRSISRRRGLGSGGRFKRWGHGDECSANHARFHALSFGEFPHHCARRRTCALFSSIIKILKNPT
jgi:hypothetical protein